MIKIKELRIGILRRADGFIRQPLTLATVGL